MEERGLLADARRLLHRVGDDHHGKLAAQLVDQFLDLRRRDRVQRRTGFVHQQHFGRGRDCPRDAQALLLAARQAGAGGVQTVLDLVPQRRLAQAILDDLVKLGLVAGQPVDLWP
jgi:hypothetical protein